MNSLSAVLFSWTKTWRAQKELRAQRNIESTAIYTATDTLRLFRSEMENLYLKSAYFVLTLFTLCSGKAVAGEHSRAFSIGVPASAHVFCAQTTELRST